MNGEPIRTDVLVTVCDVIRDALAIEYEWGVFPARTVDRRALPLTSLGDRLRVLVLDDDGSHTPLPELHDGELDDTFNFLLSIQINDPSGPSLWGHRALRAIKCAFARATAPGSGALWAYTKLPIVFESEAVVLPFDQDGRFGEYILPCTARLPENFGSYVDGGA